MVTSNPACVDELDTAVASVESAVGEVPDAAALVAALVPLRRRLDAASAGLAARAADQKAHLRTGHKDEVHWLARTAGVSRRAAKDQLDTTRRLAELPLLARARQRGDLSAEQATLVARAVEADPSQQKRLLGLATREDLKGLKDECDRIIAGADPDPGKTHERIRRDRAVKFWKQHDGTHCLLAKGTAEDIGLIKSRVGKEADAVFAAARKAGRREPYEAYRFDALLRLAQGEGTAVAPKRDLLFLIDWSAAKRGRALPGETCEIAGVGPVPVDVALDFDADPFIKAVIRDGTDVRTVVHYGRSVPAELRTALEARGLRCAVPGCSNDAHLQVDHAVVDHADGGPLALWNAQYLCSYHHRQKTLGLLDDLPPPGESPSEPTPDEPTAAASGRAPPQRE